MWWLQNVKGSTPLLKSPLLILRGCTSLGCSPAQTRPKLDSLVWKPRKQAQWGRTADEIFKIKDTYMFLLHWIWSFSWVVLLICYLSLWLYYFNIGLRSGVFWDWFKVYWKLLPQCSFKVLKWELEQSKPGKKPRTNLLLTESTLDPKY